MGVGELRICSERLSMMGTLSSEFKSCLQVVGEKPRIYADANIAAGLVAFMRERLRWTSFSSSSTTIYGARVIKNTAVLRDVFSVHLLLSTVIFWRTSDFLPLKAGEWS